MNRTIRILAKANAILFSFIIPFTVVYMRQERMYSSNHDQMMRLAAEMEEQGRAARERIIAKAEAKRIAESKKTAQKAGAKTTRRSSLVKVKAGKLSYQEAIDVLPFIAQCESGNDPLARNKTSSAKGWLQIIDGTWDAFSCSGSVLNKDDNLACGIKIATQSGLHHWNPSKHCWSELIQSPHISER